MGLLDLFRPKWKHSDANVRAEAVREFSSEDDWERLTQVARHDRDVRVRRIALKKLDDPALLWELAEKDADEALRKEAAQRASDLLVSQALAKDDAAIDAVKLLRDGKSLVEVACKARTAEARQAAVHCLTEPKFLVEVVRKASDHAARAAAIDELRDEQILGDLLHGELTRDLTVRALAHVEDRALLSSIADKSKNKQARLLASEKLGVPLKAVASTPTQPKKRDATPAKAPAPQKAPDARDGICQRLEILTKSDDASDFDDVAGVIAVARADWHAVAGTAMGAQKKRFDRAVARLSERGEVIRKKFAKAQASETDAKASQRSPVAEPVRPVPVERPAVVAPPKKAEPIVDPEQVARAAREEAERVERANKRAEEKRQREAEQAERIKYETEKRQAEDARRTEEQQRNLQRVLSACEKLEKLTIETPKIKAADQALKAAHEVITTANPLPRDTGPEARKRYDAARSALMIKLRDVRDNDDWQRWANVPKLEDLCARMDLLRKAVEADARGEAVEEGFVRAAVPEVLKVLQAEWKSVGAAPKEKSESLWQRFKDSSDAVYGIVKAATDGERASNLVKKEALIDQVEALRASLALAPPPGETNNTDWKAVGERLRELQASWKSVGLLPSREQGEALWQRFKAAADQVHAEQKRHYAGLDEERGENAKKKEALCQKAEAQQYGTDWKAGSDAIKQLQADWKKVGAAPKEQNDALWQRFRTACDKFFARRQAAFAEQDGERAENAKKKEALIVQVEALLAREDIDQDAAESEVKRLQVEWKRVGPPPREQQDTLWQKFRGTCDQVFAAGRQYTMPVTQDGEKFSNKLPIAEALARSQAAAETAGAASEVSPTWEADSASAWADIDRDLAPDEK